MKTTSPSKAMRHRCNRSNTRRGNLCNLCNLCHATRGYREKSLYSTRCGYGNLCNLCNLCVERGVCVGKKHM